MCMERGQPPDPHCGAEEALRLVSRVNDDLLKISYRGDGRKRRRAAVLEPGEESLA